MASRVTRLAPVVVAGLLAAGCGAGSSGSSASQPTSDGLHAVQAAYATTSAEKTAKVRLVESVKTSGRSVTVTGNGAIDFAHDALDTTETVVGQQVTIRELNDTVYVELPAAERSLLGGKQWASVDIADLGSLGSLLGSGGGSSVNPSDTLSYLEQVTAGGFHEVGTATVTGVPTTEYSASVDLRKVAAARGGAAGRAITALIKTTGTSSYPVTVWLDGKGVARQLRVVSSTTGSVVSSVTSTVTFSDFGTPVSVTAPPADQTTDITHLLQSKLGSVLGSSTTGT